MTSVRTKGIAKAFLALFAILVVVALFPTIYFETREFTQTGSNPESPTIGNVPVLVSLSPTTKKYYWIFISCTETKEPYTLRIMAARIMAAPPIGTPSEAQRFIVTRAAIKFDNAEVVELLSEHIESKTLKSYNWQQAIRIPIPGFKFEDGMEIELILELEDADGNNNVWNFRFSGSHEIARASLGMQ